MPICRRCSAKPAAFMLAPLSPENQPALILKYAREAVALAGQRRYADLETDRIFQLALAHLIELTAEAARKNPTESSLLGAISPIRLQPGTLAGSAAANRPLFRADGQWRNLAHRHRAPARSHPFDGKYPCGNFPEPGITICGLIAD